MFTFRVNCETKLKGTFKITNNSLDSLIMSLCRGMHELTHRINNMSKISISDLQYILEGTNNGAKVNEINIGKTNSKKMLSHYQRRRNGFALNHGHMLKKCQGHVWIDSRISHVAWNRLQYPKK